MTDKCTVGGCRKPLKTKALCQYHYNRQWAAERKAALPKCICGKVAFQEGMCKVHYKQWAKHQEPDEVEAERIECSLTLCSTLAYGEGMCRKHYYDFLCSLDLDKDA